MTVGAIEAHGLRKQYGRKVALHGLDLRVEPGEVFGFLGPNGAGKTTALKILMGLVHATAGEARIFGRETDDREARRLVGYLPENFRFHDWMTGEEMLDFHGRLAGMSPADRKERIPAVLNQVGLAGRGGDRIRGYSKGMTQRIGLAQAVLHRPELVLLDEPTSALDPLGRRDVRDFIHSLKSEGTTVFLNSHLLGEVEMVCDRVAIVDHGRVVRAGSLAELMSEKPNVRLSLDRVDASLLTLLASFGTPLDSEGTSITLEVVDPSVAPSVVEAVVAAGYRLFALVPGQRSLEDVFVGLVEPSKE